MNAGDILKGGDSHNDTLIIGSGAGAENFAQATITGVEKVVLNGGAIDVSQNLDVKSVSVNTAAATGLNVRADQTVILSGIKAAETITYTDVTGATDATTVKLVSNAFGAADLTIAGIENLTLDLSGKNTVSDMDNGLVATDLETLVFTGTGSYQGKVDSGAGILKSIDATKSGGVDIKVAEADLRNTDATHKFDAKLSAFADKFAIDELAANSIIDGGLENDTFVLSGTTIATAATAVGVKGFEIFEFTGAVKHDMSVYEANNDIKSIVVGATVQGLTNVNEGADSIVFKASSTAFETLTVLNTPTIVLDASEHGTGGTGVDIAPDSAKVLTTDALALNVHSIARTGHAASTAAENSIADITATGLKLVTITGDEYVKLDFAAATKVLANVDASALTNGAGADITLAADTAAKTTFTMKGSAGNDKLAVTSDNDTANDVFTFVGNGGDDAISYTATKAGTVNIVEQATTFAGSSMAGASIGVNTASGATALTDKGVVKISFTESALVGAIADAAVSTAAIADGNAFEKGTNVYYTINDNKGIIQIDINGDGFFNAADDYQVTVAGSASDSFAYANGDFTFTAK